MSERKLRILHVAPAFFPAIRWGGPIQSVHELCKAIVSDDHVELKVLTSDSAGPRITDSVHVVRKPMALAERYEVFYCKRIFAASFSLELFLRLPKLVLWADVVHLTSVYSAPTWPTLLACRVFRRPLIWSPRGSFYRWSGARRSRLKALWNAISRSLIPRRTVIHCTSEKEATESSFAMPTVKTIVIPNGVMVPAAPAHNSPHDQLRIVYLGLISPVKALNNLVTAMNLVGSGFKLDVYGTASSGYEPYETSVRQQAAELCAAGVIEFHGFVEGQAKHHALHAADVLVVPSHSENFSNVVCEALSYGLPVIVSKGAPWRDVEVRACGLWVDNSPESLASALRSIRAMDRSAMGERGRRWMQECFTWSAIGNSFNKEYRALCAD